MKKFNRFIGSAVIGLLLSNTIANATTVERRNYSEVSILLDRLVNFDELKSNAGQGKAYDWPLYYAGLKIGTHFQRQIPGWQKRKIGHSIGLSRHPAMNADLTQNVQQELRVIAVAAENLLASKGWEINAQLVGLGRGTIAARFADGQSAIAFEVHSPSQNTNTPEVLVTFYLESEGKNIIRKSISGTGSFAFVTDDESHSIWGVTLESANGAPFAIDNLEYQRPVLLGQLAL